MNTLKAFLSFLQENRDRFIQTKRVIIEYDDPTYGGGQRGEFIEIIDFDALCQEIDNFSELFKEPKE